MAIIHIIIRGCVRYLHSGQVHRLTCRQGLIRHEAALASHRGHSVHSAAAAQIAGCAAADLAVAAATALSGARDLAAAVGLAVEGNIQKNIF